MAITTYADGKPCKFGHGTSRYRSNNDCVTCGKLRYERNKKTRAEIWKQTRREKYASDDDYRKKVGDANKATREKDKDAINARRRNRWANDPAYREARLAAKRGIDQRPSQLKANYGITIDDYNAMLAKQDGKCAICGGGEDQTLCVDHCHKTQKVRALLCRKCNTGLGFYRDDVDLMAKAILYLEAHRGN